MKVVDEEAALAVRAARYAHEPGRLWPGTRLRDLAAAESTLALATQRLLAGERVAVETADARLAGHAAFRLGIGPLLGWWLEAGRLEAAESVAAELASQLDHGRRRYARLAAAAAAVLAALREAGVEAALMKGLACARHYPEPGTRAFQDVDLLVAPERLGAAEAVLRRLGFTPGPRGALRQDWMAPGFEVRSVDLVHADGGWGVDLHRGLARTFHRVLRAELPAPAPADCPRAVIGGATIHVLPPPLDLAVLALNAGTSLKRLQLTRLIDIVLAGRACGERAWWELFELASRSQCGRFVYPALELAERFVPGAVNGAVLSRFREQAPPRLVRAARAMPLTGLGRRARWQPRYALLWARTAREAAGVVWRQVVRP